MFGKQLGRDQLILVDAMSYSEISKKLGELRYTR